MNPGRRECSLLRRGRRPKRCPFPLPSSVRIDNDAIRRNFGQRVPLRALSSKGNTISSTRPRGLRLTFCRRYASRVGLGGASARWPIFIRGPRHLHFHAKHYPPARGPYPRRRRKWPWAIMIHSSYGLRMNPPRHYSSGMFLRIFTDFNDFRILTNQGMLLYFPACLFYGSMWRGQRRLRPFQGTH
ncbi:hypothetical protein F5Y15DRAFT_294265 [Xylariaceae sp. FL0016]|nr:hypothetical protein F5Y15DRAFT_294265 [Xylariaceae sp. FL0016]